VAFGRPVWNDAVQRADLQRGLAPLVLDAHGGPRRISKSIDACYLDVVPPREIAGEGRGGARSGFGQYLEHRVAIPGNAVHAES
jgi:hypothetical protein